MLGITRKSNNGSFKFPLTGYMGYFVTKFFHLSKPYTFFLERFETMTVKGHLRKITIDNPIYITGLARAGTTIVLEMLSKHPDLATHQYKNLLMPYIPIWLYYLLNRFPFFSKPSERIHKDGIMVTQDSPEAVEEIFWRNYFKHIHNEHSSDIIDANFKNPRFERFYDIHIKKLLYTYHRPRYLAKNNYNITRLEYLQRLFPTSKFLLSIRNPVNHIASLIKQTKLFMRLEKDVPLLQDWLRILGHQEFGHQRICINVDNTDTILKIRKLWKEKKTYVKGWAYYWMSIYEFIANRLETNQNLKNATLIVNYDELCEKPAESINKILNHTELSPDKFKNVKEYFINNLNKPNYYSPHFTDEELADIYEITQETANRFGINFKN